MSKLYIMVGASGAGKTTWIRNNLPEVVRVEMKWFAESAKSAFENSQKDAMYGDVQVRQV